MTNFEKVRLFMKTYGQEVKDKAGFSDAKTNKLRIDLIKEELEELTEAMQDENLLEVADALTDIKCFEEVQNSNMSKLGEDGKPIYNEGGKVMKGPNYFKPDLSKYLN